MLFFILSALLMAALITLGVESLDISSAASLYPRVIIAASALLLLVCTAQSWLNRASEPDDLELASLFTGSTRIRAQFAGFCIVWVLYPVVMPLLGFTVSTVAAFYLSALMFGNVRHAATLFWTPVFVIVFTVLLKFVIYVPVPETWPDRMIDSLIYRL